MGECGGPNPGPSYGLKSLTGYESHDYSKNRAPAYSLGLKTPTGRENLTPGPYAVSGVDRFGRYPYLGWTMESTGLTGGKSVGPGPLSYAPEKVKVYTPAYSLGLKLPGEHLPFGPSPAEYFPQYPPAPGCTIGHAYKDLTKFASPGPKPAVPTDLFKPKAPAYSLGLRGKSLFGSADGPGPKYNPQSGGPGNPGFSFGMKHHKCAPPLITYDDN